MACSCSNGSHATMGKFSLIEHRSQSYYEKIETFRYDEHMALTMLVNAIKSTEYPKYFDRWTDIANDEYFFATKPHKYKVNLSGYYLNGRTGEI